MFTGINQGELILFNNCVIDKTKTRLLTICGTYRRPQRLMQMIDSWRKTKSDGSELAVYLSDTDPCLEEYRAVLSADGKVNYVIDRHRWFIQAMNFVIFDMYPGIPYYSAINDDHIYRTPNWDAKMIAALEEKNGGWGWVFANDMIDNGKINTHFNASAEVFAWKFVEAMGYAYPPDFRQFGVDIWAQKFLRRLNKYTYLPEIEIEHLCNWALKRAGKDELIVDDNYNDAYSAAELEYGYKIGDKWMTEQANDVVRKVMERMHRK